MPGNHEKREGENDHVRYIETPKWGQKCPDIPFASVEDYETLATGVELIVQHLLAEQTYNTVGNFVRFYDAFKKSGCPDLELFYRSHKPQLCPSEKTCVGLGLELMSRLCLKFPRLRPGVQLASSEESVEDLYNYINNPPVVTVATEKEHVLVAINIIVGHNKRRGVLLLDPGYHVARAVTVMEDNKYPHTGWFMQSEEPWVKREYRYTYANNSKLDYVIWDVRETRPGKAAKTTRSLVYVGTPFLSPIAVTEKRNLVYDFRSWLARSTKGEIIAGIHFPLVLLGSDECKIRSCAVTVIYTDSKGLKQRTKIRMEHIYNQELTESEFAILEVCDRQLGMRKNRSLHDVLTKVATILHDVEFIKQLLNINESINIIGT